MFTVEVTQHFDDWFVDTDITDECDCLDDAIFNFGMKCEEYLDALFDKYSLDDYISNNLTDDTIGDCSKGFLVAILDEDGEIIISLHFNYDFITKSIIGFDVNEFEQKVMDHSQISKIQEILNQLAKLNSSEN